MGKGVHKLKGEVGQFADLSGQGDEAWQKETICSLPRFGRQGACHDTTKFEDSQTKTKTKKIRQ